MRGACLSSVLPALAWTAAITAMALVCKWVGSFKKLLWEQTGRERETQIVWRKKARGPGWACRGPRGQCFWSLFPTQYSISWCISCPGSVVIEDSNDDNNDVNRMKASNPLFFPPEKCCQKCITEKSSLTLPSNVGSSVNLMSEVKKKGHRETAYANASKKSAH